MKKTLYITSGAPNAGKTSFVKSRIDALGGIYISRDEIRSSLLTPGEYIFKNESKVFNTFIKNIQEAIDKKFGDTDIYIDATHLNSRSRHKVLGKLNLNNVDKIIVLWFDIPLEILLGRNFIGGKERVPQSAVENMYKTMDMPDTREFPFKKSEVWRIDKEGWCEEAKVKTDNLTITRKDIYERAI